MRFGLFGSAQARRGDPDPARGFRDFVECNVEAEALGYASSFVVEHHFTRIGQISATLTLLTWIAARTRTLRLGTAVIVLPWHNPVLLAEEAATLDLLSGGRLDFGVGRGYRHSEFHGFALPIEEADARFAEGLDVIRKAWTAEERFSHHGPFWHFEDVVVEPPPQQKPHPPLWMAAGSPRSIGQAAARGANLLLDQFASAEQVGERIALYRAARAEAGRAWDPLAVAVARNCYVATDAADAEAARRRQAEVHQRMIALSARPDGSNRSHILAYAGPPGATEASALIGTPETIAAELEALKRVGVDYVLLNCGGSPRESLRRFAREVMPAFA